ncbi:MAG: serine hydrolase domain-containing protein [Chitinophagia bacterium]|jgi:CubicO group peptidase (beta-lactamase class C family)
MSHFFSKVCCKVSATLVFLLLFQFLMAQSYADPTLQFEKSGKELGSHAALAIIQPGKPVYIKTIGEFTAKDQAPLGSISQWLTTALVLSFVDAGKISLDDKVSQYIPLFTKYAKGYITIRDCLTHFSGIEAEPVKMASFESQSKFATLQEEVESFATKREIRANPSTEFYFSQVGLNIAARVLEVITRRGFEQLMGEKITRPLMMRSTSFSSFSAVNPSGGAIGSANDLSNFLTMLLNKGMFNGKRILSEASIAEMQKVRTTPSLIKSAPLAVAGMGYSMGAWVSATNTEGVATALDCTSLCGSWAGIDWCRNYGFLVLTKKMENTEKSDVYKRIRKALDDQLSVNCK